VCVCVFSRFGVHTGTRTGAGAISRWVCAGSWRASAHHSSPFSAHSSAAILMSNRDCFHYIIVQRNCVYYIIVQTGLGWGVLRRKWKVEVVGDWYGVYSSVVPGPLFECETWKESCWVVETGVAYTGGYKRVPRSIFSGHYVLFWQDASTGKDGSTLR